MPRKQPKAGDLVSALGQKPERRRSGRAPRPDAFKGQFSLAAILLLMTVVSVGLAFAHNFGTATINEVGKVTDRALQDAENFPESSAAEFVPIAAGLLSLSLALLLGAFVFHQRVNHGLAVVWLTTCLGMLGLVLSVSLTTRPLATTPINSLTWMQIVPVAAFALSCALPLGAIGGWYARFVARW